MATKKDTTPYVEDRGGYGFVYFDSPEGRVVWQDFGDRIEVNNHSNWGTVSGRQHKAAAEALRDFFADERPVKQVLNITHDSRQ